MKIVVLGGAGDMGSRAVRDLAKKAEVTELVIADINTTAADKLANELGEKVKSVYIDANRPETLIKAMLNKDVSQVPWAPSINMKK